MWSGLRIVFFRMSKQSSPKLLDISAGRPIEEIDLSFLDQPFYLQLLPSWTEVKPLFNGLAMSFVIAAFPPLEPGECGFGARVSSAQPPQR
jgi:hypothetical protein